MTRLRSFGASAKQARLRAFGASVKQARVRPFGTTATQARLLLLLVAALGLLAARPAAAQTEIVEYYGHDALGSIRIVFTASGVATARADYEPFGEAVTIAGMPAGPLPAQQFTGQERDQLERQDYFGARYYRPRHGRFSQVDPVYAGLFDPQQWNRYAYARSNPLSFVDPTGEYTRDANSPGGYSCADILKDNPGDALCNPFHAPLVDPTTTLVSGVRVDVLDTRIHGADRASRLAEFIDEHVVDLDAMPPGDSTVLELGLVVLEQNLLNLAAAPVAVLGVVDDAVRLASNSVSQAGNLISVIFGHGARHVPQGASAAQVELGILRALQDQLRHASAYGYHWGWTSVDGVRYEYRAFRLPDGRINVGTYYPRPRR